MNITFLHPDLGIGGAERLVVDAALALKSKGHHVELYTSYHDSNHCFPETKDGRLTVTVVGNWIPRSVCGRFHALFAYLRMMYVALFVVMNVQTDLIFCDIVSACIPVLKLNKLKVVFYCHYPDMLLTDRKSWLKRLYRYLLDYLEEKTTGMADIIIVNSQFTASVFHQTFKSLECIPLEVVYPAVKFEKNIKFVPHSNDDEKCFLSINRYERKKNIQLAIWALKNVQDTLPDDEASQYHLIIAGGYDERVKENKEYYLELKDIAKSCGVQSHVTFLKSPSDNEKQKLIHRARAILYTPENEHFGIVPLEAMYNHRPVIACNSGGPLETIEDKVTGFLCKPTPEAFAKRMVFIATRGNLAEEMGYNGSLRVSEKFSFEAFAEKLHRIVTNT